MVKALACPAAVPVPVSEKRSSNSEDVADFVIPTKLPKKAKVSDHAPVLIGLQKFSDNCELCGLHGSKDKVVVLMMDHTAKPNYFFKFLDAFGNFLDHMHGLQNAFPTTMEEFEKRFEMRFVMASDPPIENQKPYARGAYVKLHLAGKVIEVLDSFFWWRHEMQVGGIFPAPEVIIVKGTGVTLTQDCQYECTVVIEDGGARVARPFSPLQIPGPAWSKRHACVKMRVLTENTLEVRFEGDTISFRSQFSTLAVPGRYESQHGEPLEDEISLEEKKKASYVRIIKSWDVTEEEKCDFLLEMLSESVYENTLVIVQWLGDIKESTAVAVFQTSVTELANVYAHGVPG